MLLSLSVGLKHTSQAGAVILPPPQLVRLVQVIIKKVPTDLRTYPPSGDVKTRRNPYLNINLQPECLYFQTDSLHCLPLWRGRNTNTSRWARRKHLNLRSWFRLPAGGLLLYILTGLIYAGLESVCPTPTT